MRNLREQMAKFRGQFGEQEAYLNFLSMRWEEQEEVLLKMANHIANCCASADEEPDENGVKVSWAARHAHDFFILLCLFLGKDWEVESERFPFGSCKDVLLPYPEE